MESGHVKEAVQRSRRRSLSLVLKMFSNMAALAVTQGSMVPIMRYMAACFHYRVDTIVIGSHPYSDDIVPFLGSSYSQKHSTRNTPTTDVIAQHFQDHPAHRSSIVRCVCESWKTIMVGCIWLNASYDNKRTVHSTDVMSIKRLHYTIEFICTLLMHQAAVYKSSSVTLLSMGREAQFIASSVKQRLIYHNISCTIVQSGQPAQLARVTYNRHLVGSDPNYMSQRPGRYKHWLYI